MEKIEILKAGLQNPETDPNEMLAAFEGSEAALLNALIELAVHEKMLDEVKAFMKKADFAKADAAAEALYQVEGHPLAALKEEADTLNKLIESSLADDETLKKQKDTMWNVSVHDMKKGDLLYPTLKVRYGLDAPSLYLWDSDIAVRQKYSGLMRQSDEEKDWCKRMDSVLHDLQDMLYVEENLLYPMTALTLSPTEWQEVYYSSKDYPSVFGLPFKKWDEGEAWKVPGLPDPEQAVVLQGGTMTVRELNAMLNNLPLEITFVDADGTNAYFNIGHKAFKRPLLSLGHEVFECHPHQVGEMVKGMIADFKSGKKDKVNIWMMKQNEPYYVTYMALRDTEGTYLGTLEVIQPMQFAKEHFSQTADFAKGVKSEKKGW